MSLTLLVVLIVVFFIMEPIVLIWAIVRVGWSQLAGAFPQREVEDDAIVRRNQSFRVGLMIFGFCIHVAADQRHLHLEPAALLQWLGAQPASIPWEAITPHKRLRRGRIKARIEPGTTRRSGPRIGGLVGPSWCMELAGPVP